MSNLISFDYAIKYLLKDKGDYEIVEGFISAILSSGGYSPVKIKALLETESNKEDRFLKRSLADLIVEDEDGNNYIVEIDRAYTSLFLHKACFNSCRLIVDNLGSNQDYLQIKKVFHINLLYFPFKNTNAPLHHGKVIFHEIDRENAVDIHLMDRGMHSFDISNIFPEYFVISIPLFDDVIRKEIDEWLYMMKHSEVKEGFKSPYMKKVAMRLDVLKMSTKERETYDGYVMESMKNRDYLVSAEEKGEARGVEKGIEIGIEQGIEQGIEKIAKNMLRQKLDDALISFVTGLSSKALKGLKTKL